jgi:hypothetical protein
MSDQLPPPQPSPEPLPSTWSHLALALAAIAFVLALPILWWKLMAAPVGATLVSEAVQGTADAIRGNFNTPQWVISLRAASVICAFLSMLSVILALILKNQRRSAGIATVLALAALAVTAPLLFIAVLAAVVGIIVVLFSVGLM